MTTGTRTASSVRMDLLSVNMLATNKGYPWSSQFDLLFLLFDYKNEREAVCNLKNANGCILRI